MQPEVHPPLQLRGVADAGQGQGPEGDAFGGDGQVLERGEGVGAERGKLVKN